MTFYLLFLENGFIPEGARVILNIFDVHRDPDFWIEPDKFDPDRFLPENVKNRHAFSYLPFSAGLRNCIGKNILYNL